MMVKSFVQWRLKTGITKLFFNGKVHYIEEAFKAEYQYGFNGSNGTVGDRHKINQIYTSTTVETDDTHSYPYLKQRSVLTYDRESADFRGQKSVYQYWDEDTDNWRIARPSKETITFRQNLAGVESPEKVQQYYTKYNGKGLVEQTERHNIEAPDDPEYLMTAYSYDNFGNNTYTTQCSGHYTSKCALLSMPSDVDDRLGGFFVRAINRWDSEGRHITSINNGVYTVQTFSGHNEWGLPTEITDADGKKVDMYYDAFGQTYFNAANDGNKTETVKGQCTSTTCPDNAVFYVTTLTPTVADSTVYLDGLGRTVAKSTVSLDGTLIWQNDEYNNKGQLVVRSQPYLEGNTRHDAALEYDDLGRMWRETGADGTVKTYNWKGMKESVLVTSEFVSAFGNSRSIDIYTSKITDGFGQLIESVDPDWESTYYAYDAMGNLTNIKDHDDNETVLTYDDYGRKTRMEDVDKGDIRYRYNGLDALVKRTAPDGSTISTFFDAAGRKVRVETVSPGGNHTGWLDYQGALLDKERVDGFTKDFHYDSLGRRTGVTYTAGSRSWQTSLVYDQYGRLFQRFDTSGEQRGKQVEYQNGYVKALKEARNPLITYYSAEQMDGFGNVTRWTQGNNITTEVGYDPQTGFMTGIGSEGVQTQTYQYDGLGNLRVRQEVINGNPLLELFTYDEYNRLTSSTFNGSINLDMRYYTNGNIKYKSDVAAGAHYNYGGQPAQCANKAGLHAVSSIGTQYNFCYDLNGNQIAEHNNGTQTRTVSYTGFDKPDVITSFGSYGMETQFAYDANFKRFWRADNGTENTETYYIGGDEIHINTTTGVTEHKRYLDKYAQHIVRSNGTDELSYFYRDHIGSLNVITGEWGPNQTSPEL